MIKTKLIDWNEEVVFAAVHENIESTLRDAMKYLEKTIQLRVEEIVPGGYYFQSKEECLEIEIKY